MSISSLCLKDEQVQGHSWQKYTAEDKFNIYKRNTQYPIIIITTTTTDNEKRQYEVDLFLKMHQLSSISWERTSNSYLLKLRTLWIIVFSQMARTHFDFAKMKAKKKKEFLIFLVCPKASSNCSRRILTKLENQSKITNSFPSFSEFIFKRT